MFPLLLYNMSFLHRGRLFMQDLSKVKVVLVNTSHPGNIGASARAMKNMGLSRLGLVQPKDFPSGVAAGRAASAVDILETSEVFDSLEEAIADCGLVIGTSARSRRIPWPMLSPTQTARKVLDELPDMEVALVFGREDAGLNNDELQQCHYHVQIPTNENYSSLNLAAAVMVIGYELFRTNLENETKETTQENEFWDQDRATGEQVEHFYRHLERVMIAIDFHDPKNPRQLMQRMRRLFSRIRMDVMEMNILRGILTNIELHIKNKQK